MKLKSTALQSALAAVAGMEAAEEKPGKGKTQDRRKTAKGGAKKASSSANNRRGAKRKSTSAEEAGEEKTVKPEAQTESSVQAQETITTPGKIDEHSTAGTGHGCGEWMKYVHSREPAVNENELISLNALIAYVAHVTEQAEFRVERMFADRFNIPNVKCLPADRYDDAVRYLVDQVPQAAE